LQQSADLAVAVTLTASDWQEALPKWHVPVDPGQGKGLAVVRGNSDELSRSTSPLTSTTARTRQQNYSRRVA
jgi:hypothetical protein